jgi:RES domain-containing protein
MLIYRLQSRKYALDNSAGASLYGGRWNLIGTPVIYASATISLAALEILRHHGAIPAAYAVIEITLPEGIGIEKVPLTLLPRDWITNAQQTAEFGTEWAASKRTAVLQVPSAEILFESNYILNPLHSGFGAIAFRLTSSDPIGPRLR